MSEQHPNNNFNFLRLLLAILVLLAHAPELADGSNEREILSRIFGTTTFGELAVDGFFLLSGYLIVQSWQRAPEAATFIKKRVLRIFPAFIFASLVCAFIVGPLGGAPDYVHDFRPLPFIAGMLLLQLPVLPPTFADTVYPLTNGAMWTIPLEFGCYMLVVVAGSLGMVKRRLLWAALAAAIFCALFLVKIGHPLPNLGTGVLGNALLLRLGTCFSMGGVFYLFREKIRFRPSLAVAAAVVLCACMYSWRASGFALATCGAYLLFYFAFARVPVLAGFGRLPDVSYGVYLYGFPVQKLLLWYVPGMSPWVLFALSLLGSLVLGTFSWYAIEKPFMRLKYARAPRVAIS